MTWIQILKLLLWQFSGYRKKDLFWSLIIGVWDLFVIGKLIFGACYRLVCKFGYQESVLNGTSPV